MSLSAIWLQKSLFVASYKEYEVFEFVGAHTLFAEEDGQCHCKEFELGSKANKMQRYMNCLLERCFDFIVRLLLTLFLN